MLTSDNATTLLPVTTAEGTVYLTGLVRDGAATDTAAFKAYGATLVITDGNGVDSRFETGKFTVVHTPTVSTPGVRATGREKTPSQTLRYACQSTCTFKAEGQPDGVVLSTRGLAHRDGNRAVTVTSAAGTLSLSGQVSTNATVGDYLVTVTITDGSTTVASSGVWRVS